jgi:protease stability complex PrcB-like protein
MTFVMTLVFAAMTMQQSGTPLRQLDKGDQSNVDDARQAVARTADEYNTLWRLHTPDRPQPKVDFAKEMVVGVFMGSRPTAGFAIEIVGTREEGGALVVQYRETRPARGMITAQVITSAYHIVAMPSRPGAVRFERLE